MKMKLSLLFFSAFTLHANATGLPVVDVAHIAETAGNQIANYVEYAQNVLNTYEQIENQVTQITHQLDELRRLGDMNELLKVLGVDQLVNDIMDAGATLNKTKEQIAAAVGTGKDALTYDGGGSLTPVGEKFTIDGQEFTRETNNYKGESNVYLTEQNATEVEKDVRERNKVLQEQMTKQVAAMESAKDDAEFQKLSKVMDGMMSQHQANELRLQTALAKVGSAAAVADVAARVDQKAEAEKEAKRLEEAGKQDVQNYRIKPVTNNSEILKQVQPK